MEEEVFALKHKEDSEEAGQRATQYARNGLREKVKEARICQRKKLIIKIMNTNIIVNIIYFLNEFRNGFWV